MNYITVMRSMLAHNNHEMTRPSIVFIIKTLKLMTIVNKRLQLLTAPYMWPMMPPRRSLRVVTPTSAHSTPAPRITSGTSPALSWLTSLVSRSSIRLTVRSSSWPELTRRSPSSSTILLSRFISRLSVILRYFLTTFLAILSTLL